MHLTKSHWYLLLSNALYIVAFGAYYVRARNYEFLWYVAVLVFFVGLIALTLRRSRFPTYILWGFSVWGFLHMAGGSIHLGDHVLYAQHLMPIFGSGEFFVLKYDQFVHFFGFGVTTLAVYHLLVPYLNEKTNWKVIYFFLVMTGAGVGVVNEIVEFIAVLSVPNTGVGGYGNTLLDLIFNMLGAVVAVGIIHRWIRPRTQMSILPN